MTMVETHLVKWEYTIDFDKWLNDSLEIMSKFPGFLGQNTTLPVSDGK